MKKFMICFLLLTIGFSCKKDNTLCGCSPVVYYFNLSVKNTDHIDLLAPNTAGGYTTDQIQISYKDGNQLKPVDFQIIPPFSYGTGAKYEFYQIISSTLMQLRLSGKTEFYIRFGDSAALPLSFDVNKDKYESDNVKIDNKPLTKAEISVGYPAVWVLVQ